MKCPDELTLMMLADNELQASKSVQVREHIGQCDRCRVLLTAVRAERRALVAALSEALMDERPTVVPASRQTQTAGHGLSDAASLGIAVLLVLGLAGLATAVSTLWDGPRFFGWPSPLYVLGQAAPLSTRAASLVFTGLGILTSISHTVRLAAAVGLLFVLLRMARVARRLAATGTVVVCVLAVPGEAFVVRESQGAVVVPVDETVDDTLVVSGQRVIVDGVVVGDLIATAERAVQIRGVVQGNVLAATRQVSVSGEVGGSVFAAGQVVNVSGRVSGSLYGFAQHVRVLKGGWINGSVAGFGEMTSVGGTVERTVRAAGDHVEVAGTVERDVSAVAERISVGPGGRINGKLTAYVPDTGALRIAPAATLGGPPNVQVGEGDASAERYVTASFYVREVLWLFAALATGAFLLRVAPRAVNARFESPTSALRACGVGLLCVVIVPVGAVIVGITVAGLPFASAAFGLLVVCLYLAKIVVAVPLGRSFVGETGPGGLSAGLAVGLAIVLVAVNLPFVGPIINAVLTFIGVGVLFAWVVDACRPATRLVG